MRSKLAILAFSVFLSFPFYMNGPFADSLVYFGQAETSWLYGLIDAAKIIYTDTGKFEPVALIVFYIQGWIIDSPNAFCFINAVICNVMLGFVASCFFKSYAIKNRYLYLTAFLFSYLIFSNVMYVWRTIYAVCFLLLAVKSKSKWFFFLYLTLAFLSHKTAIIFFGFYLVSFYSLKLSRRTFFFIALAVSVVMSQILKFTPYISDFVSNGSLSIFSTSGDDVLVRVIINAYMLIAISMMSRFEDKLLEGMYRLSLLLIIMSMLFYFNWQLMWRISIPAMIIIPILYPISKFYFDARGALLKFLFLFASSLPTFRLIYLMVNGRFV